MAEVMLVMIKITMARNEGVIMAIAGDGNSYNGR